MQPTIRCLIIDDEPPARDLLQHYLSEMEGIEVSGECSNGLEALKAIHELKPQLLLLDIQMPRINGFELLEVMDEKPEVIFCTAYDEFAIKAFEMHAVDYLLKPFSRERLKAAVDRAALRIRSRKPESPAAYTILMQQTNRLTAPLVRIIAKTGTTLTVIPVESILYLEAQDDYVLVVSEMGNHLKEKTMKFYEEHLSSESFLRIHRSYIVNIRQIRSISLYGKETWKVVLKSGAEIKASAQGYKMLKEIL